MLLACQGCPTTSASKSSRCSARDLHAVDLAGLRRVHQHGRRKLLQDAGNVAWPSTTKPSATSKSKPFRWMKSGVHLRQTKERAGGQSGTGARRRHVDVDGLDADTSSSFSGSLATAAARLPSSLWMAWRSGWQPACSSRRMASSYLEAVEGAFWRRRDYAQLVKLYGARLTAPRAVTAPPNAPASSRRRSRATPTR